MRFLIIDANNRFEANQFWSIKSDLFEVFKREDDLTNIIEIAMHFLINNSWSDFEKGINSEQLFPFDLEIPRL